MIVSGTPGHVTEDQAHKHPYMIGGHLLRFSKPYNIYELTLQQSTGGTLAGSPLTGVSGDKFGLTATPVNNDYIFSSYSITGSTLTGNSGTFVNSDVTAKATFKYAPPQFLVKSFTPSAGVLPKLSVIASGPKCYVVKDGNTVATEAIQAATFKFGSGISNISVSPTIAANGESDAWYPTTFASAQYRDVAKQCYMGDLSGYFAKDITSASKKIASDSLAQYEVPNGIGFQNGGFISGFYGQVHLSVYNGYFKFRVVHDGVTGSWTDVTGGWNRDTQVVIPISANVLSSTEPFIIQCSGSENNTSTTQIYNNYGYTATFKNTTAYHPCWSGTLYYKNPERL